MRDDESAGDPQLPKISVVTPTLNRAHMIERAIRSVIAVNARFFHRSIFEEVGLFDTRYRIAADWDFMIRVALREPRIRYVRRPVYRYGVHEGQVSWGHDRRMEAFRPEQFGVLE